MPDQKVCTRCGIEKQGAEFHRDRQQCSSCRSEVNRDYYRRNREVILARTNQWQRANRELSNKRSADWRAKHPDRLRSSWKRQNLKRYGLTIEAYEELRTTQEHRCAISERPHVEGSRTDGLCVDHCHACSEVRGLLNSRINMALGIFNEDPALLRAAADYLERHSCREEVE